jgi:hypothetical protein
MNAIRKAVGKATSAMILSIQRMRALSMTANSAKTISASVNRKRITMRRRRLILRAIPPIEELDQIGREPVVDFLKLGRRQALKDLSSFRTYFREGTRRELPRWFKTA